jgi:hypothetical protein
MAAIFRPGRRAPARRLMCTLSFSPRRGGYHLAMNRDEKRARPAASSRLTDDPPRQLLLGPRDPRGGRWIVLNDQGVSFALLNWNTTKARIGRPARSRGEIVNAASARCDPKWVRHSLSPLLRQPVRPFRLFGFFPDRRAIFEWRWNSRRLTRRGHAWTDQLWASSSWDERAVQHSRTKLFRAEQKPSQARNWSWTRRLHSSHLPEKGPLAICMHRDDAVTVSYTEIEVMGQCGIFRYQPGAPCEGHRFITGELRLQRNGCLPSGSRLRPGRCLRSQASPSPGGVGQGEGGPCCP